MEQPNSRKRTVSVTPLLGAGSDGNGPRSSLIKLGPIRILIDCGWDSQFKEASLHRLKEACSSKEEPINLILLSFGDLEHVGALPLIIGKLGLKVPIYCTLPTLSMGQQTLYEAHQCQPQDTNKANSKGDASDSVDGVSSASSYIGSGGGSGGFTSFSLDHIDEAFKPMKFGSRTGVRTLKYNEALVVKDFDLSIVPISSGRNLGGAMWKLKWQTDEILYATDFNVMNETTITKASLDQVSRPSLLITDATNWNRKLDKTLARWGQLKDSILKTVRVGGNVLLPSDAAGRSMELLHFLDKLWGEMNLGGTCRLVFLHSMARNVVQCASSMLEWMSVGLSKQFDENDVHPFELRHVEILNSISELDQSSVFVQQGGNMMKDPRPICCVATHNSLELGASRELLTRWAKSKYNRVIFTSRPPVGTVGAKLQKNTTRPLEVTMVVPTKSPLKGIELEDWERARKQAKDEAQVESDRKKFIEELSLGVSSEALQSAQSATTSSSSINQSSASLPLASSPRYSTTPKRRKSMDKTLSFDGGLEPDGNTMQDEDGATSLGSGMLDKDISTTSPLLRRSSSSGMEPAQLVIGNQSFKKQKKDKVTGPIAATTVGTSARAAVKKLSSSSFMYYTTPKHVMIGLLEPHPIIDHYGSNIPTEVLGNLKLLNRKSRNGVIDATTYSSSSSSSSSSSTVSSSSSSSNSNSTRHDKNEKEEIEQDAPFKWIKEQHTLMVRCETLMIELEGRPDHQALLNVLAKLAPRRLVVAYGPPAGSLYLRQYAEKNLITATAGGDASGPSSKSLSCVAPAAGVEVVMELDSRSYDVLLEDPIVSGLRFAPVKGATGVEVAFCRGILKANTSGIGGGGRHSSSSRPPRALLTLIPHDYVADTGVVSEEALTTHTPNTLLAASSNNTSSASNDPNQTQHHLGYQNQEQGHKPYWISSHELKILALKKALDENKAIDSVVLRVVDSKHQLLVGDSKDPSKLVIVRQSPDPSIKKLMLEGSLCPAYFEVRKVIYKTMTLV